jgi:hypothetical protein
MRYALLLAAALGLAACDDSAKAKTEPKSETSKKTVKVGPVAKADTKTDAKTDTKADAKADAKADSTAKEPDAPPPDPSSDEAAKIVELARLARAIAATPEEADAILEKAGMDRSAFETQMLAVAKDQWRTDLYLTALAGADRAGTEAG